MKKIPVLFILMASMVYTISSCHKEPKSVRLDAKWKNLSDDNGNLYETSKIELTSGNGITFSKEVMMEDLCSGASSDGSPVTKIDPVTGSNLVQIGCYKDLKVNCDTLGALYSAEAALGSTISQLVTANQANGDADGDGFDDQSVKQALIAAGYDPNIYTLTALYNVEMGFTGITVNDTIPAGGVMTAYGLVTGSTDKNLTYGLLPNGDTVYTPGANGKILVPNFNKIDFSKIVKVTPIKPVQGSCPEGWHIPSDGEWKTIELSLGMSLSDVNKEGFENDRGAKDYIGPKLAAFLKLKYSGYWSITKNYAQLGEVDAFWTSTGGKDKNGDYVWIRYIDTLAHKGIIRKKQYEKSGFTVRCFKD